MGKAKQTVTIVKTSRTKSKAGSSGKGGNPNRCPSCGKFTSKGK